MENERTENIFYLDLKHVHKYGCAKIQPNPLFSSQWMGTEHAGGRNGGRKKKSRQTHRGSRRDGMPQWPNPLQAWSWGPLNRSPVRPRKGAQWQKTAWHLWATVDGWVSTESQSGATKRSLVCRTTIAHCNRQFLSFTFCSSQCRHVLHCHRTDCRSYILNFLLVHLFGLPGITGVYTVKYFIKYSSSHYCSERTLLWILRL